MKKHYQKPTAIVHRIVPVTLICASIRNTAGADGLGIGNTGTGEASITTGNSRRRDYWEDYEGN